MQSVSARIWSRITVSISYDDNHSSMAIWRNFTSQAPPLNCDLSLTNREKLIFLYTQVYKKEQNKDINNISL